VKKRCSFNSVTSELGIGLLEALIASAMVAIVALIIAYMTISGKNSTVAVGGSSQCRERAQYIISTFKNADNRVLINGWHPNAGGPPLTTLPNQERFMYPVAPSAGFITAANVNNWELMDDGTNWALSLVHSNPGYCNSPAPPTPPGFQIMANGVYTGPTTLSYAQGGGLAPPGTPLVGENEYLNIQVYDFNAGAVAVANGGCATATQRIIPMGANPNPTPKPSETTVGLQLTATITYTDPNGGPTGCYAQTTVRPEADVAAPYFVKPPTVPVGSVCTLPPDNICIRSTGGGFGLPSPGPSPSGVACNPAAIDMFFAANESGVIFACQVYYSPTNPGLPLAPNPAAWAPCSPTFGVAGAPGVTAGISNYDTTQNANTSVDLTINAPINGYYELFVTSFDSAGNQAVVSPGRSFAQAAISASFTGLRAVSIVPPYQIAVFNTNDPIDGHLPVMPPLSTALSPAFGVNLFQCIQTSAQWTTVITPPTVVNAGLIWSMNGAQLNGSNCTATVPNPNPLPDASPNTMTGVACDQCGTYPAIVVTPVTWNVDLGAAPSPAAYGGPGFGIPSPTPSWTLGVAKPLGDLYEYACEDATGAFTASTTTCAPALALTCSAQGSGGFCTAAVDGCGRAQATSPTSYFIYGKLGDHCGNNPCGPGLICGLDIPNLGVCVKSVSCAVDSGCGVPFGPGHNICFLPMGTCHGINQGPVDGGPTVAACPSMDDACGLTAPIVCGGGPPPVPSPTPVASPAPSP